MNNTITRPTTSMLCAGIWIATLLLCSLIVAGCSVTTSPDDSTLAPKLGTKLIFEEYTLNLNNRTVDTTKPIFTREDRILGAGLTYDGKTNVLLSLRQNADTLRLKHEINGDVSIYQPDFTTEGYNIDGRWITLPYGTKVGDTVVLIDTNRINGTQQTKLRIIEALTFEGPATMVFDDEPLAVIQVRAIREQFHSINGLPVITTQDTFFWYAPSLGYIVHENSITSQTTSGGTPSFTGTGRTLLRIE